MENPIITKLLERLEYFKEYMDNGQTDKALDILELIKKSYFKATGRDFDLDFPEDKLKTLIEKAKGENNLDDKEKEKFKNLILPSDLKSLRGVTLEGFEEDER